MKFNFKGKGKCFPFISNQMLLVMKFLAFFMTLALVQVSAKSISQKITYSGQNVKLEKVFKAIRQQSGYAIFYNYRLLEETKPVSLSVKNATIEEVLAACLKDQPVTFTIERKTVVIKAAPVDRFNTETLEYFPPTPVKGKITDDKGLPLSGVTITVKGSNQATTTNEAGDFQLTAPSLNETLVVSYVGFESQEIALNGRTSFSIQLKEKKQQMDQVIVVGYGTQRKRDITGAISSIDEKTLREVPATNALQLLQGRAPGVYVTQGANKPGSLPSVRIRGQRSFGSGSDGSINDPLYVIDGIPVQGGFNDISPNDIESMDVLKDASATAIYGSRGSNGVIIITTKRGKEGKASLNYNTYAGVTKVTRQAEVFTGPQFINYKREAYRAISGQTLGAIPADAAIFTPAELELVASGEYSDWASLSVRDGFTHNHELSVNGGAKDTRYNVAFGFFDDKGYIKTQDYRRYTTRFNFDQRLGKIARIGMSTLGTFSERNGGDRNPYFAALTQIPLGRAYNSDGSINLFPSPNDPFMYNPLSEYSKDAIINIEKRFRLLSSIYAEAEVAKGLKLRVNFGPDLTNARKGNFSNSNTTVNTGGLPQASSSESFAFSYTLEDVITYDRIFGKHKLNFTGLYSIQEQTSESSSIEVQQLPVGSVEYFNLGSAGLIKSVGSGYEKWSLISYMGRINYSFDGRFLLTLTGRQDGSSRFGPGNKWGFFPSAALAYNLSDESFLRNAAFLSNLKLRVSYGQVGNTTISPYQTLGLLATSNYDYFGVPVKGKFLNSIYNPDLKWERTTKANIGVDFGFFNSRITGSAEVYNEKTTDLLLTYVVPATTFNKNTLKNIGSTRNSGVEIGINTKNIVSSKGFEWSTDFNIAYNKEEILELSQGKVDDIASARFIGKALSVSYDYEKIGIWQLGQEADAVKGNSSVGQIRVKDQNNDKLITAADRIILGNDRPSWTGGVNNRFSYKGFDLSVFVVGRSNVTIRSSLHSTPNNTISLGGRYNNLNFDYWTPTNPTNAYPRPYNGQTQGPVFGSTLRYFDGSFLRIRNINCGYTLPANVASKIKAQSVRINFDVTNPYIFSSFVHKYNGVDPEVQDVPAFVNYLLGLNIKF